jgi:hypothetical protein
MGERKMSSGSRLVREGEGEGEEGEDIWAKATKAADDLYILRDTYFPPNPLDKISKLQSQSDLSLNLLDSIPLGGFSFSLASILIIKKIYLFNRMLGTWDFVLVDRKFGKGCDNFNDPFVLEH